MRTAFIYSGSGKITVGGADELWLFINGVFITEMLSTRTKPCRIVNITQKQVIGILSSLK